MMALYAEQMRRNRERLDFRRLARLRSVLDGDIADETVAARVLNHPVAN